MLPRDLSEVLLDEVVCDKALALVTFFVAGDAEVEACAFDEVAWADLDLLVLFLGTAFARSTALGFELETMFGRTDLADFDLADVVLAEVATGADAGAAVVVVSALDVVRVEADLADLVLDAAAFGAAPLAELLLSS